MSDKEKWSLFASSRCFCGPRGCPGKPGCGSWRCSVLSQGYGHCHIHGALSMTGEGHFTASSLKDLPVRRNRANPPPRSPKYPHFPGCRLHHGLGSAPAAPAASRGGGRGAEGWEDSGGGEVGTETRSQTWRKSPPGQDFSSVCGFRTAQVRWVRVMWPFRVRCVGFSTFFLPSFIYLFKVPPSPLFFSWGAKNRGKISSGWSGEKGRRGKESISPCKMS